MKKLKIKNKKWEEKDGVIYVQFREPVKQIDNEEFTDSKTILEPKKDPEIEFDNW